MKKCITIVFLYSSFLYAQSYVENTKLLEAAKDTISGLNLISSDGYNIVQVNCSREDNLDELLRLESLLKSCLKENLNDCLNLCNQELGFSIGEVLLPTFLEERQLPSWIFVCQTERAQIHSKILEKKCSDKTLNRFKNVREVKEFFNRALKKKIYRMENPDYFCYERAFLLAHELYQKGFHANLVEYHSSSSIKVNYNGHKFNYINHWVVEVEIEGGEKYILDPQFFDEIQTRKSYAEILAPAQDHQKIGFLEPAYSAQLTSREQYFLGGRVDVSDLEQPNCNKIIKREFNKVLSVLKSQ